MDKAMILFRQYDYEATSLVNLVEAIGAETPILYAELANKEGLLRAVLDHCISCFVAKHEAVLLAEGKPVDQILRDYFTVVATCFTSKEAPAGCFIINTSAVPATFSTDTASTIKSRHTVQGRALTQFLQRRQAQSEPPTGRDVALLAQFLNYALQGTSVNAREGADSDKLMQITDTILRLWPQILES